MYSLTDDQCHKLKFMLKFESKRLTKTEKALVDVFCRAQPCARHIAVESALDPADGPTFYTACELVRASCHRCPLNGESHGLFSDVEGPPLARH